MGKTYKDDRSGKYAEERRKRELHKKNKKSNKQKPVDDNVGLYQGPGWGDISIE